MMSELGLRLVCLPLGGERLLALGTTHYRSLTTDYALRYSNWLFNKNLVPGLEDYGITMGTLTSLFLGVACALIILVLQMRRAYRQSPTGTGVSSRMQPRWLDRFRTPRLPKDLQRIKAPYKRSWWDKILYPGRYPDALHPPGTRTRPSGFKRMPKLKLPKGLRRPKTPPPHPPTSAAP